MTVESAQRLSDILMAVAFAQQGFEHLAGVSRDRWRFMLQIALAGGVAADLSPVVLEGFLLLISLDLLRHFRGPYNGGSDRMRLLVSPVSGHLTWRRPRRGSAWRCSSTSPTHACSA